MTVDFIAAGPEHTNFIVNSWVESFRDSHAAGMIRMTMWRTYMWPEVEAVLARPGAETLVAVAPNVSPPGLFYGFVCVDTTEAVPMVFYVYVKEAYRRAGYARMLLEAAGVDPTRPYRYTCKTPVMTKLARLYPLGRWDPLYARYPKAANDNARDPKTGKESR